MSVERYGLALIPCGMPPGIITDRRGTDMPTRKLPQTRDGHPRRDAIERARIMARAERRDDADTRAMLAHLVGADMAAIRRELDR